MDKKKLYILWPHGKQPYLEDFIDNWHSITGPEFQCWLSSIGYEYEIIKSNQFNLEARRNQLVDDALEAGAEWLFLVDTDIIFPQNVIRIMMKTALKFDIKALSGCYYKKGGPMWPVYGFWSNDWQAAGLDPADYYEYNDVQQMMFHRYFPAMWIPENGVMPIDVSGLGCMLVHRSVFETIGYPYFEFVERPLELKPDQKNKYRDIGEDFMFCCDMRKHGIQLYLHCGVQCHHLAVVPVGQEDTYKKRSEIISDKNHPMHDDYRKNYEHMKARLGDQIEEVDFGE